MKYHFEDKSKGSHHNEAQINHYIVMIHSSIQPKQSQKQNQTVFTRSSTVAAQFKRVTDSPFYNSLFSLLSLLSRYVSMVYLSSLSSEFEKVITSYDKRSLTGTSATFKLMVLCQMHMNRYQRTKFNGNSL
ncbi:hypothetical protein ACTXT7_006635 [Hymenolepis weldensis]